MKAYALSPKLSAPTSVMAMMLDVIVALLPALATGIYLFGPSALYLTLSSVASCLFFHQAYGLIFGRKNSFQDPSPWVTGLLLALCYPADLSLWAVPFGSFFAIVVVKELFGGYTRNFVNPALAGRLFLASSPLLMIHFPQPRPMVEANLVDALSSATPMASLQQGLIPSLSPGEMFLGFHSGSLGEVSTLMLFFGGCYLILRQVITPTIPLCYLGTVAVLTFLFPQNGQDSYYWMVSHLCSGGLMLGAFFMATDPVTSPVTPVAKVLFGCGCGILTVLLRYYGSYPEGVAFAILTMNALVWCLDKSTMPRIFGEAPFSKSKKAYSLCVSTMKSLRLSLPEKEEVEEREGPSLKKCILTYAVVLLTMSIGIYGCHSATSLASQRATEALKLNLLQNAMPKATFMSETPYQSDSFNNLYLAYADHDEIGYCIDISSSGFRGEIRMLVGVDFSGSVTGIAILEQEETAILGESVLNQQQLSRFKGRSGTLSREGDNAIDTVSGATITFDAVLQCVNQALIVVQQIDQGGFFASLDEIF